MGGGLRTSTQRQVWNDLIKITSTRLPHKKLMRAASPTCNCKVLPCEYVWPAYSSLWLTAKIPDILISAHAYKLRVLKIINRYKYTNRYKYRDKVCTPN